MLLSLFVCKRCKSCGRGLSCLFGLKYAARCEGWPAGIINTNACAALGMRQRVRSEHSLASCKVDWAVQIMHFLDHLTAVELHLPLIMLQSRNGQKQIVDAPTPGKSVRNSLNRSAIAERSRIILRPISEIGALSKGSRLYSPCPFHTGAKGAPTGKADSGPVTTVGNSRRPGLYPTARARAWRRTEIVPRTIIIRCRIRCI